MTEPAPDLAIPAAPPGPAPWPEALPALRQRFPGATDGILFCIHKLERNPNLGLRDMRGEAASHGINLAGRSLHSARGLLGISAAATPPAGSAPAPRTARPAAKARPGRRAHSPGRAAAADETVESRLSSAVRQLQEAAAGESRRLRAAMATAIRVLQEGLDA